MNTIDITDMSNRQIEELVQTAMVELQERELVKEQKEDLLAQEEIKQSRRTTGA